MFDVFGKKSVSDVMREVNKWEAELGQIAEEQKKEAEELKEKLQVAEKEAQDAEAIQANLRALLNR